MASIINSIGFQNFYNYYGGFEKNTFYFKRGINIVNADNNMGKSKFYNGILWMLKDQVYDSDLKQLVDATDSFSKMMSAKAKNEEIEFDFGVQINFSESSSTFNVCKIVHAKLVNDVWRFNLRTDVTETIEGKTKPINDTNEIANTIQKFIPTGLLDYALLQGESMEKLVNLSSKDGLSATINVLTEITVLDKICKTSNVLTGKANKLYRDEVTKSNTISESQRQWATKKTEAEDKIQSGKNKLKEYSEQLSTAKQQRIELEAYIGSATKRAEFKGKIDKIEEFIKTNERYKNDKEKNVTSKLFANDIPWVLLGFDKEIDTFVNNYQKLIGDIAVLNDRANRPLIQLPIGSPDSASLRRMLDNCKCEVCGREAERGSDAWNHIQTILNRPQSHKPVVANDFSEFYGDIQKSTSSYLNRINRITSSIDEYRDSIDNLKSDIQTAYNSLNENVQHYMNMGGVLEGENNQDAKYIADYNLAYNQERKCEKGIADVKSFISTWEKALDTAKKKLSDFDRSDEISKYTDFCETVGAIERIFAETKDRIFNDILNQLNKNANEKYEQLTEGNFVDGGRLDFSKQGDIVQVSIRNKNDDELTGLGTGFQRMKQLSIVMAIISSNVKNKHFDYPFISDAPFSEFGDNFIFNFFKIAPQVFTQSIILIKDLYDPKESDCLNDKGRVILNKMKNGEITGTFYVNQIEKRSDITELSTIIRSYI